MKFSLALMASMMLCLFTASKAAISIARANNLQQKMAGSTFPDGSQLVETLQERVIKHGKCDPHICFALDGSASITRRQWRKQKEFVQLVSAIIGVDRGARFAAVQYGLRLEGISPLTKRINKFLRVVNRERQLRARATFVAAGLGYCITQFRKKAAGQPQKIVLLGDGRSNFGGNPIPIARRFLSKGPETAICAVGVGFFRNIHVLERITRDPARVLTVDDWDIVTHIMHQLVEDICGLPHEEPPHIV